MVERERLDGTLSAIAEAASSIGRATATVFSPEGAQARPGDSDECQHLQ
jgi:hypothetical protein